MTIFIQVCFLTDKLAFFCSVQSTSCMTLTSYFKQSNILAKNLFVSLLKLLSKKPANMVDIGHYGIIVLYLSDQTI